jgi:hypothetical protein
MRDFMIGVLAFTMLVYALFFISSVLNPINHLNILEWVGVVGIGIIIKAGIDIYYKEITEHN